MILVRFPLQNLDLKKFRISEIFNEQYSVTEFRLTVFSEHIRQSGMPFGMQFVRQFAEIGSTSS